MEIKRRINEAKLELKRTQIKKGLAEADAVPTYEQAPGTMMMHTAYGGMINRY